MFTTPALLYTKYLMMEMVLQVLLGCLVAEVGHFVASRAQVNVRKRGTSLDPSWIGHSCSFRGDFGPKLDSRYWVPSCSRKFADKLSLTFRCFFIGASLTFNYYYKWLISHARARLVWAKLAHVALDVWFCLLAVVVVTANLGFHWI